MIFESIEFFGAVELTERFNGLQLQRIPEKVRDRLNPRARWNSQMTNGLEIRFVSDTPHVRLFLSSLEGDADVEVYCGDFHHSTYSLKPGGPCCIHVEAPERFKEIKYEALQGRMFSPNVWRFILPATQTVFHELETYGAEIRPPSADEQPALNWLAYGSSITAGGYVRNAACLMGVDSINLAMGGACHCEAELADFIADRGDWDFATFELGVNMRDIFPVEEFTSRVNYLIKQTLEKNKEKPVFLITTFPNMEDFEKEKSPAGERQKKYNEILRKAAEKGVENLYLIEGYELMPDFCSLSKDLIHPSKSGHAQIAGNLAGKISPYLEKLK
jgi:hypothetical protein